MRHAAKAQAGADRPILPTTCSAATLYGEVLSDIEIVYDEIGADGIVSRSEHHVVRVRPTQDPAEVIVNETALPWVRHGR